MADDQLDLTSPEAVEKARRIVYAALDEYAQKRIDRYGTLTLGDLLKKDLLMLAMRGISSAEEILDAAFAAFESSSEETHMGAFAQRIATDLADGAIDLSDVLVQKDGDLWVVEVKSQTNTITGTYRADAVRRLKLRVERFSRVRRVSGGRVRGMLGVLRGPSRDREIVQGRVEDYEDLEGFAYTEKVGRPFWEWLTGQPGIASMIDRIPDKATDVGQARVASLRRLQSDLGRRLPAGTREERVLALLSLADASNA